MQDPSVPLFDLVVSTLRQHQGVSGPITPSSRLCGQLGVCDDDLSDLVEELFRCLGYTVPAGPTELPASEDMISVADLVAFLEEWPNK